MNSLIFCTLSFAAFALSNAKMPSELRKILGLEQDTEKPTTRLQEDLKKDPDTFLGREFDFDRYLAQSASIEEARRKLGAGDVEEFISAPVQTVECHVEFQVTKRVPGRCTKLAGNIPACQSPQYIGINYNECA